MSITDIVTQSCEINSHLFQRNTHADKTRFYESYHEEKGYYFKCLSGRGFGATSRKVKRENTYILISFYKIYNNI